MDIAGVLGDVRGYLDREAIPFALVGALALHTYGYARATNDLDLLVGREAQDGLISFLEKRGFETLHPSDGYSNHLHPTLGRVDVIYVDADTRVKIMAGARLASVGGTSVLVPKPELLAAMKVHAMSSNDRPDLLDLERGLPTTEEDVIALRKLRYPSMTDAEYMRFLTTLHTPDQETLRAKHGPRGEPFKL